MQRSLRGPRRLQNLPPAQASLPLWVEERACGAGGLRAAALLKLEPARPAPAASTGKKRSRKRLSSRLCFHQPKSVFLVVDLFGGAGLKAVSVCWPRA